MRGDLADQLVGLAQKFAAPAPQRDMGMMDIRYDGNTDVEWVGPNTSTYCMSDLGR